MGITVKGVGFRLEPVEGVVPRSKPYFEKGAYEKATATYPYTQPCSAVRLKVGFTRTAVYPLAEGVKAFFLKPTIMYLYGTCNTLGSDDGTIFGLTASLRAFCAGIYLLSALPFF